jgi:hypothetical protein
MPSAVIGGVCIVAGGLVAAATAPAPSEKASWVAAYLVLVGGVAQVGLALGQAIFGRQASTPMVRAQRTSWTAGWTAGNALVVAGTLSGLTALTDIGGLFLLATLLLLVPSLRTPNAPPAGGNRWLLRGYRGLVLLLLISIPAGLLLARLRP